MINTNRICIWIGKPILTKMLLASTNIDYYTLLVLNRVLYIEYLALAIVPSWVEFPVKANM